MVVIPKKKSNGHTKKKKNLMVVVGHTKKKKYLMAVVSIQVGALKATDC